MNDWVFIGVVVACCALGPTMLVLVVSYLPDVVEWMRGGPNPWRTRPKDEQLAIDILRAKGLTRRAATKRVEAAFALRRGHDEMAALSTDPAREDELREIAVHFQNAFDDDSMPEQLRAMWLSAQAEVAARKG